MVNSDRKLKVFLCHSSGDKPQVRSLYQRLQVEGVSPWLDEQSLLPGQDWHQEITKAVRSSDIVIVCLSCGSISKAGYVQKEIKYALDIADEQPEGAIFLIPLKLEECDIPERLRRWQWVNYYEPEGFEKLLRTLRIRAESLGIALLDADKTLTVNLREKVITVANRTVKLTEREFFIYTLFAYIRKNDLGREGFVSIKEIKREQIDAAFRLITASRGMELSLADYEDMPRFEFIDMLAKQADSQNDKDYLLQTFLESRAKMNRKFLESGIPDFFCITNRGPRRLISYGLQVSPEKIIWGSY